MSDYSMAIFHAQFQDPKDKEHELWSWHVRKDWLEIDRSDPVFEPLKKLESDQFECRSWSGRVADEDERNSFHEAVCKELELIKGILK